MKNAKLLHHVWSYLEEYVEDAELLSISSGLLDGRYMAHITEASVQLRHQRTPWAVQPALIVRR